MMGRSAKAPPVVGAAADFLDDLLAVRGLSPRTVASYRRDLMDLKAFLKARNGSVLAEVKEVEIEAWLRRPGARHACATLVGAA